MTHTEVDQDAGRSGLGSSLVRSALDDVRSQGIKVVPLCPFVRGWIDRHPDYADLVADDDA
jgi:predicted GNAT family acetyltransferase